VITAAENRSPQLGNDDSTREEAQVGLHTQRRTNQRLSTSVQRHRLHQTRISESGEPHAAWERTSVICIPGEATDSDSDSADDDQASTDAGAATVNATDANETVVRLVAQREPRLALVPCDHQRFCKACIRHLERILEVVVLSAVSTSARF